MDNPSHDIFYLQDADPYCEGFDDNIPWVAPDMHLNTSQSEGSAFTFASGVDVDAGIDPTLLLTQHHDFEGFLNDAAPIQHS